MDTYTPASNKIIHYTYVDLSSRQIGRPVHLVQYDDKIPILAVTMYRDGMAYAVPSNAKANIRLGKPDGAFVYNPALGTSADRTVIYFEITRQMSVLATSLTAIVELEFSGSIAGSEPINIIIDRNPVQNASIESTTEFKTGQQYALESEASAKNAEASEKAALISEKAAKISEANAAASETAAEASYRAIAATDIGVLETGLVAEHSVYDSIWDSSGNLVMDSSGNNMEASTIFIVPSDILDLKKRTDSVESIIGQYGGMMIPSRVEDLETDSFETMERVSDLEVFSNNTESQFRTLERGLLHNQVLHDSITDSSGDFLMDGSGNQVEGAIFVVMPSDIADITKRTTSVESVIKQYMTMLIPTRVKSLEADVSETIERVADLEADGFETTKRTTELETISSKTTERVSNLEAFSSNTESRFETLEGNLLHNQAVYDSITDSFGNSIKDSNGDNISGQVLFALISDIYSLRKAIFSLEQIVNSLMTMLIPSRVISLETYKLQASERMMHVEEHALFDSGF